MFKKAVMIFWVTVFFGIFLLGCGEKIDDATEKEVAVEVTTVIEKDIARIITLTAQFKPAETVMIFPKNPGLEVTQVAVRVGDQVKKGDYLFELDKTLVRKQIEQAKRSYDMARENYQHQKNQITEREATPSIGRIPSQYYSMMMEDYSNTSLEAAAQLEQARTNYVNALDQLENLEYYAPIEGMISQVNITEYQISINTQPAVVITNSKQLKSVVHVAESLYHCFKKGQRIPVEIGECQKTGIVETLNSIADPRSNLYTVELVIDNSSGEILPGAFGKLYIEREKKTNTIVIPKSAILLKDGEEYVYILENNRARKRKVVSGIDAGDEVEIIEGISSGEKIVVKGQHYIEEGTLVMVVRSDKDEDH